jgi:hypothetical protein
MKASLAITLLQWAKSKVHIFLLQAAVVIDPTAKGTCLPAAQQIVVGEALSGTTISLDMLFLFVPFFMLRGRGVSSRVKMYIYSIFGLGVAYVNLLPTNRYPKSNGRL